MLVKWPDEVKKGLPNCWPEEAVCTRLSEYSFGGGCLFFLFFLLFFFVVVFLVFFEEKLDRSVPLSFVVVFLFCPFGGQVPEGRNDETGN